MLRTNLSRTLLRSATCRITIVNETASIQNSRRLFSFSPSSSSSSSTFVRPRTLNVSPRNHPLHASLLTKPFAIQPSHLARNYSTEPPTTGLAQPSIPAHETTPLFLNEHLANTTATVTSTVTAPPSAAVVEAASAASQSAGLFDWVTPTKWVVSLLDSLHLAMGLPWWATIVVATATVRLVIMPMVFPPVARNTARLAQMAPEMEKISDRNYGEGLEARTKKQQDTMELMKKNGVNPLVPLLSGFVQMPLFLSFFWALKDMPSTHPDMASGGVGWIQNLAAADPYYVLPIVNAGLFLATTELAALQNETAKQNPLIRWLMRGLSVSTIPFTMNFPAAVLVYWTTNSIMTILQQQLFVVPAVRRFFNIPILKKKELLQPVIIPKPSIDFSLPPRSKPVVTKPFATPSLPKKDVGLNHTGGAGHHNNETGTQKSKNEKTTPNFAMRKRK